ncbi:electron transfer flavoprotein subunit beta/FixA family protein [Subtercola lobariae]|uniref:Electron transfer flavoprotein subunit beta n=1 Tax=Subtercola lobariae TaxID=1588641 RepID=A0A917BA38_9MICO|nr:electron transfer flavoprotein subunit beta/FixA family protein [Subtercola lobariae]GGF33792.1 electron transfer flavoprotein subunit beta [Subtercola lobariae]
MKIIVLMKEVPDTYGERKLDPETGIADRAASDAVLDEINERALEFALAHADRNPDTEVVVLTMAPDSATASLRKGLAMGAHSAVHIADPAIVGADYGVTAEVLSAAITRLGFDLVIAGNQSTDGASGILPAMIAETLDLPQLTNLTEISLDDSIVRGTRATDEGVMTVSAALPAVISVTEALAEARFPSFKGILAAKKKPYEMISLSDLNITIDDLSVPRSILIAVAEKPPRQAGVKVDDQGDAGQLIAEFLISNLLA